MPSVAVVGAGISGLTCARTLADHGFSVKVFEKSRGVGGRMATRRTEDGYYFDHGAQYFTARDSRFSQYVHSWIDDGIVRPWQGRIVALENGTVTAEKNNTDRFVAVPKMNAICRHLAEDLDIQLQTHINPLERREETWRITDKQGAFLGQFDTAVVSAPAGQTAELLQDATSLAVLASQTVMQECWAVMLAFSKPVGTDFDGAFVHNSPLSWVAKNSSKPGRDVGPETWVLHAAAEWSHAHLEDSAENVARSLTEAFWSALAISAEHADCTVAHRWRYALPPDPLSERCLFDLEQKVAACGDWCGGPRVEGAFLSGAAAAGRVMGLMESADIERVVRSDAC